MKEHVITSKGIQSKSPLYTTLASTIASVVENSYVPMLFVSKAIEANEDNLQKYIQDNNIQIPVAIDHIISNINVKNYVQLYSLELHTKYHSNLLQLLSALKDFLVELLKSVTGINRRKEAAATHNKYVDKIKKRYRKYAEDHERELGAIQDNIDKINKVKPLIKGYILEKLSAKLHEMGFDSKVSDYPMENIDLRNFPIKDEYNIIKNEKLTLEKETAELYEYLSIPLLIMRNFSKANELKEKQKVLKYKVKLIEEKMTADMRQLESLNVALSNISKIFNETESKFRPLLEKIIEDIEKRYRNDYQQIPEAVKQMMHSSSKILKEMTEKRIVPKGIAMTSIDSVVKYSNQLSLKYNCLKETLNSKTA